MHISPSAELLLAPFLLSFWKVGSRAEAISRERSPCRHEHHRLLMPLPSREEWVGEKSAQTAHKRKVCGSERYTVEQN